MSGEEKKALDQWLSDNIKKQLDERFCHAEQSQRIAKDIKNNRPMWKDFIYVMVATLTMLSIVWYSANAEKTSTTTKIELESHKQVNNEQFANILARMDRQDKQLEVMNSKMDRIIEAKK